MNNQLKQILSEVFALQTSEIHAELTKEDVVSWDSLKQMDLIVSLENAFPIVLDFTDITKMNSVNAIVTILESKGVDLADS